MIPQGDPSGPQPPQELRDAVNEQGVWIRQVVSHGNFEAWHFFRLGSTGGAPTHVFIRPVEGGDAAAQARGITTTVLREVNPNSAARHAEEAFQSTARMREQLDKAKERSDERKTRHHLDEILTTEKGPTDRYLSALAIRYEALTTAGERSPVNRLIEITGKSHGTVKSHVQLARKKEFLEAVGTKAGGMATSKAKATLQDEEK
ncbi:hypothetical protein GCM10017562_21480 [Streptomyces roseofulvus]